MSQLAIETRRLSKRFDDHLAVDELNLEVPAGTLYGLIGPNGAGKTTTLRMLAGLEQPSGGKILLRGKASEGMRHTNQVHWVVGFMPDFFGVYEDMRVWEYLDFFARCYKIEPNRRKKLVDDLLALVDLTEKYDADVNSLSRGMKQRLCLAHALVHDPQILLLDEPASGLDPRARMEMRELLIELRNMGKTVIISSHILSEMEEMCDAVGIMERGKLLAGGDVDEIERSISPGQPVEMRVLTPVDEVRAFLESFPGIHLRDPDEEDELDDEVLAGESAGDEDQASQSESMLGLPGDEGENIAIASGTWIDFFIEGDESAHADLIAALVRQGIQLSAYRPRERDLERMFMEITKGELA